QEQKVQIAPRDARIQALPAGKQDTKVIIVQDAVPGRQAAPLQTKEVREIILQHDVTKKDGDLDALWNALRNLEKQYPKIDFEKIREQITKALKQAKIQGDTTGPWRIELRSPTHKAPDTKRPPEKQDDPAQF